jgi:hypothetical protein
MTTFLQRTMIMTRSLLFAALSLLWLPSAVAQPQAQPGTYSLPVSGASAHSGQIGFRNTAPAAASTLKITTSDDRLLIEGLRPGASVALLSAAHERAYYMSRIVSSREVLTDDDRDGRIEYKPASGIAFQSIWIITDLASGETKVITPAGYKAIEMFQQGAGRGNAVNITGNIFDIGRERADILVVRPNEGAWALPVREGGLKDAPVAARGRSAVPLVKLLPLRPAFGSPPPALKDGDVVAIVDAVRMEYWVASVARGAN